MADTTGAVGKGLFGSLGNLASTVVGVVHTRLELLSTDLEDERAHVFSQLVLALIALFFIGVGVVLVTILLVVAFWETDRLLVLGSLAGFYLLVGMAAGGFALHKARTRPRPFAASLAEMYKDRQQLTPRP